MINPDHHDSAQNTKKNQVLQFPLFSSKCNRFKQRMGWSSLEFFQGRIGQNRLSIYFNQLLRQHVRGFIPGIRTKNMTAKALLKGPMLNYERGYIICVLFVQYALSSIIYLTI
jgi:hypothetical protein